MSQYYSPLWVLQHLLQYCSLFCCIFICIFPSMFYLLFLRRNHFMGIVGFSFRLITIFVILSFLHSLLPVIYVLILQFLLVWVKSPWSLKGLYHPLKYHQLIVFFELWFNPFQCIVFCFQFHFPLLQPFLTLVRSSFLVQCTV